MTTQNQPTQKDNRKRKLVILLLSLMLAVILIIGSLFAFFSDMINGTENLKAGTLKIDGVAKFYIGDSEEEATSDELNCINPGDEIRVEIEVTNSGSKSAWIQGSFSLSAEDDKIDLFEVFEVYKDSIATGNLLTKKEVEGEGEDEDEDFFVEDGKTILNGTYEKEGENAEDGDNTLSTTVTLTYVIVFSEEADNTYQDAGITIGYEVKALQYRNNPSPDWELAEKYVEG